MLATARNQSSNIRTADHLGWTNSAAKVAAICYRVDAGGEVEFLLIRTGSGRWTFPKGGVDGDATRAAAAAREAFEEAGVRGRIEPYSFTQYLHVKSNGFLRHRARVVAVEAFLCQVKELVPPLEFHRDPTWFSPGKAKRKLREARPQRYAAELERVVDHAVQRIATRHSSKTGS